MSVFFLLPTASRTSPGPVRSFRRFTRSKRELRDSKPYKISSAFAVRDTSLLFLFRHDSRPPASAVVDRARLGYRQTDRPSDQQHHSLQRRPIVTTSPRPGYYLSKPRDKTCAQINRRKGAISIFRTYLSSLYSLFLSLWYSSLITRI